MDSSILQNGLLDAEFNIFADLSSHSHCQKTNGSFFAKLTQEFDSLTYQVENHWSEMPPEKRDKLRDIAERFFDSLEGKAPSELKLPLLRRMKRALPKFKLKASILFAVLSGDIRSVISATFAASKLAHAVIAACESEEEPMVAGFLGLALKSALANRDSIPTLTVEMDQELDSLLAGVSLD